MAIALGVPCGGWCPKGRRAEDGKISSRYLLAESTLGAYPERSLLNVRDSDGTLILTRGAPKGGTALTLAFAEALGKPAIVVDPADGDREVDRVRAWISERRIQTLNVAGPRERSAPGIYDAAAAFLRALLSRRST